MEENGLVISENQLDKVNEYNIRLIDGLNFSNIYNFIHKNPEYEMLKKNLADFLSGIWANKKNKQFHDSLNVFEKLGFLSQIKETAHDFGTVLETNIVKASVFVFSQVVPFMIQKIANKRESDKAIESIIGGLAYINQIPTSQVQSRVQSYYHNYNREFDQDKFKILFDKYAVGHLPIFPEIPLSLFDKRHTLYQTILSSADLKDPKVVERASQYGEFLGENNLVIDETIKNTERNLELISDKANFESITVGNLFNDLISDANYIRQSADYTASTDPFKKIRSRNKKIVVKGTVTATLAGLTYFTGPVGDMLITASIPVIDTLINNEMNVDTAIKIHDKFKTLKSDIHDLKEKKELGNNKNE